MKRRYKFIHFRGFGDESQKTWYCHNNKTGDGLATIEYDTGWRQYVFCPFSNLAIFSADCCRDIADFLDQLNEEKK